jgi:hypothetical protein
MIAVRQRQAAENKGFLPLKTLITQKNQRFSIKMRQKTCF